MTDFAKAYRKLNLLSLTARSYESLFGKLMAACVKAEGHRAKLPATSGHEELLKKQAAERRAAMIDLLIAEPGKTRGDLRDHFGIGDSTINSDFTYLRKYKKIRSDLSEKNGARRNSTRYYAVQERMAAE